MLVSESSKRLTFNAQLSTSNSAHENFRYLLSRCHFLLVFLVRAGVDGNEKAISGQSRVPMEDRADGQIRFAGLARATRMVLSAERHAHAVAVHVAQRLVQPQRVGIFGAKRGSRSGKRSRCY